ncbi:hypothetical protein [Nodosilinea nodulosa]|uniref:hypothetical protein n=1 Tax=Nodosilinea nodulosa TaxID=416001 RepID=UPI0002EC78E4|nr:hypothetical protein [Nodosilinea nodulosa]
MTSVRFSLKGLLALLSAAVWASPLALAPAIAQGSSSSAPYCFVVRDRLSVFSHPVANAATGDYFNPNDIAYATTNPPTTVVSEGRSFVEVAIYGGKRGWLPRTSTIDGVPLIVDLSRDQCTNPGPGAAGAGSTGGSSSDRPYCFVVKDRLSVFSRPAANAATNDYFVPNDIAYATTNPPTTVVSGGRSFVEVAIYGGKRGWLPRTSTIDGVPLIVDLSRDQCTNPGPGAAGAGSTGGSSSGRPYCFVVKDRLSVFSRPAANAATDDYFNPNDIAYATTNPPTTVVSGGRSFVEVAIYRGKRGWLPRTSTIDGVPLIVDLSPDQCTNPGPGAAGRR